MADDQERFYVTYSERVGKGKNATTVTATQEVTEELYYKLLDAENSRHREATDAEVEQYLADQKARRDSKLKNRNAAAAKQNDPDEIAKADEERQLAEARAEKAEKELAELKAKEAEAKKAQKPASDKVSNTTKSQGRSSKSSDKDASGDQSI